MIGVATFAREGACSAFGAAVALRLAAGGPVALLTVDGGDLDGSKVPSPPPTIAAARVAAAVRRAGHPAAAGWRLVRCASDSPSEASAILELLGSLEVPTVFAVTAPRCAAVEGLLERFGTWLAACDDAAGAAAAERLGDPCRTGERSVQVIELVDAGAAVALATAGIAAPGGWIGPIDDAIEQADEQGLLEIAITAGAAPEVEARGGRRDLRVRSKR